MDLTVTNELHYRNKTDSKKNPEGKVFISSNETNKSYQQQNPNSLKFQNESPLLTFTELKMQTYTE